MSKKTLITIIVTFLLTTLFWYLMARFWVLQPVVNPAEGLQLAQPAEDLNAVVEGVMPDAPAAEPQPSAPQQQPTHSSTKPHKEVVKEESTSTKPHKEVVKEEPTTQPAATTPSKGLKEAIVGTWKPVEGSTKTLQITSFGKMVVREKRYPNLPDEYKYKIQNGKFYYTRYDSYLDPGVRAEVTTENGSTYLTIYDDADMGGRYRKN